MDVDQIFPHFLQKIAKRQKERQAAFANLRNTCPLNTEAEKIVSLTFFELVKKLQIGQLTSSEVLSAYTAKAVEVTDQFNCVTEFNPQAEQYARELDIKAKNPSQQLGPLHGIPFAVKDDQDVEGMDTTMGFAHNLENPAKTSSAVVQILVQLGAIPFCKTNLAQSVLSFGGDNPIYGIVKNGLKEDMAPGGSSSGSASIVAAGGAPFALGSDLGGSLRLPSHYHGLATLRGTTNRLSEKGMLEGIPLITQRGVPGVITKDAKTLSYIWKCLTENCIQNQFDPMAVPLPWNETLFSSKAPLRIGYFPSLSFYPAFPGTQNTILAARDALLILGHQVVPFEMPDSFQFVEIIYDHIFGDQGNWIKNRFEGEPLAVCMKEFITMLRHPEKLEDLKSQARSKREGILLAGLGRQSASSEERMKNIYQKRILTLDILERMQKAGVDLLLSPVFPHSAVTQEFPLFPHQSMGAFVYTMFWNFLNFPAGVVKFGEETEESVKMDYEDEGEPIFMEAKKALKDSVGMPINVQVIGQPFKEELVLRALVEIERLSLAK